MDLTDPKEALEYYRIQLRDVERDFVAISRRREGLVSIIRGLQRLAGDGEPDEIAERVRVHPSAREAIAVSQESLALALMPLRQDRGPLSIDQIAHWLEHRGRSVPQALIDKALRTEARRRDGQVIQLEDGSFLLRGQAALPGVVQARATKAEPK